MDFSVVIPVRNGVATLEAAVVSALNQADTTVEVIVVDDGSTDGTDIVLKELSQKDERLTSITNQVSVGASAARNQAIAVAQGTWIAVLDADDEFMPGRLSWMLEEAERRSLDIFADNLNLRSVGGDTPAAAFSASPLHENQPATLEAFLMEDIPGRQPMGIGFCKPIMRRDFLVQNNINYNTRISAAEDFLLYAECIIAGAKFGFSIKSGYLYTLREGTHGTLFNLKASEVNRLIAQKAKFSAPSALPQLAMRQREIDYDAFRKSLVSKKLFEAAKSLSRLPPAFVALRVIKDVSTKRTRTQAHSQPKGESCCKRHT